VPGTEAVCRWHVLGCGAGPLWRIRSWARDGERSGVFLAAVQRVMWRAVTTITIDLSIGEVARTGTAVVAPLAVPRAEAIRCALVVHGARVVDVLAYEARQPVAWPRAAVHGRDGGAGLRVVVHHVEWWGWWWRGVATEG